MSDLKKFGKKLFTMSVVAMTIAWSVGLSALVPAGVAAATCPSLVAGDLFKVPGVTAVYLVSSGMQRLWFPHANVYETWYGTDYSKVKTIDPTCVDAYPLGTGIAFRGGSVLVKSVVTPSVYAVAPSGVKMKLASPEIASALYGANWDKLVIDQSDAFGVLYTMGAEISSAMPHNGMLVKGADGVVYSVSGGKLVKVEGTLPSYLAMGVRMVTDAVRDTLTKDTATVTPASLVADPSQKAAGTTPAPPPVVVGGNVTVSLAANTPAAGSAASTAIRVPFTTINFTAGDKDATVKNLVVERQGIAADASLDSISLLDAADQSKIGFDQTFNSLHQATFNDEITVKAGTTRTLILAGNMNTVASGHGGEMPKLALVSGTVLNGGTLSGTPVVGNAMTVITTLSLGTVTVVKGAYDPSAAATDKALGTLGYKFSGLRLTAGSNEDLSVASVRWYQAGSAASSDLANVKVVLDGVEYPTTVSADGKYYTAQFNGVELKKGLSKEMYIKGDVMSGSSRTVRFDVYRKSDLVVKGTTYQYYVNPTATEAGTSVAGAFSTVTPWYQGYLVTMAAGGNLRIEKGAFAAGNVAKGVNNQTLGNFLFVVDGEAVKITQLVLDVEVSGSTSSGSDATMVTLYDAAGVAVAGPVDTTDVSTSNNDGTVTFSSTITVPNGTNVYTVKANLNNDVTANTTYRVGFTTPATAVTATGVGTGNSITATPASDTHSNYQTVKAGTVTVTVNAVPVAQNLVSGSTDVVFAQYNFDASASGEDLKVTVFKPQMLLFGSAATTTDITSVRVFGFDGTTEGVQLNTGSNVLANLAASTDNQTLTLDKPFVIPKGTQKTLTLKANVSANATASSIKVGLDAATTATVTAIGVGTGTTPTVAGTAGDGQAMTLASAGQFSVELDSSRPLAQLYIAGTTGNVVNKLRFTGTTEAITVTNLKLKLTDYSTSSSDQDVVKAYLYDDAGKLLADSTFVAGVALFTLPTEVTGNYNPFVISKDGEKVMTVKLDFATISTSATIATAGHSVVVDYDYNADDTTQSQGKGGSSGSTIASYSADTSNVANRGYLYKGAPKLTKWSDLGTVPSTLTSGAAIYKFKVEADSRGGDVDLYKFTFQISTSSPSSGGPLAITALDLYDSTTGFTTASSTPNCAGSTQLGNTGNTLGTNGCDLEYILLANNAAWGSTATPVTVSVGAPHTFELLASMSGLGIAGGGASVNTQLMGDVNGLSSIQFTRTATNVDAGTNDDFIWSDKSASGHGITSADWTNGYLVTNLPGTNMSAVTLSK